MIRLLVSFCIMTLLVSCATLEAEGTCDCIQQSFSHENSLEKNRAGVDTCLAHAEKSLVNFDEADQVEFKEAVSQCLKDTFDGKPSEK